MLQNGRIAVCVGTLLIGLGGVARADGLTDMLPAEAIGTGEAARAQASGAMAPWLNPAGAALTQTYVVAGTYGYRAIDSAQIAAGAVCDSITTRFGTCLSYNFVQSGDEQMGERKLHTIGLTTAMPIGEIIALGVTGRYVNYEETGALAMPEDDSRSGAFVFDAGLVVKLGSSFSLAGVGYNLVGADAAHFPRALGGGLGFTAKQLSLTADAVWNLQAPEDQQTGRYGAGAQYFATADGGQQGYPIRAGYIYDAGGEASFVTGGLGLMTPRVGLDVALRRQVAGPTDDRETMFEVGLRLFMPN
jgi:hypothetical protein